MDTRICCKCKEDKPLTEYHQGKTLHRQCKLCKNEANKKSFEGPGVKLRLEKQRVRRARNYQLNKEANKANQKEYRKANLEKYVEYQMKRWSLTGRSSNPNLNKAEKLEILAIYEEAKYLTKETGIPHHVDHIIPLNGKCCRGIHHPENLQVITADANLKKGTRCPIHKSFVEGDK